MIGSVIVSGCSSEATFQVAGTPSRFSTVSRDIARTIDEISIIASTKKDAQVAARATKHIRRFMSFCLDFFIGFFLCKHKFHKHRNICAM